MNHIFFTLKWALRYPGIWLAMITLADFQMLYQFQFPLAIPYTIMLLAELWLVVGLADFDKYIREVNR